MAAERGTDTNLIFKEGSTHGTAVQGTTGDKISVESFTGQKSRTALTTNNIGSGLSMEESVEFGSTVHSVDVSMQVGFDNGADVITALFMGASASPAEQTVGEGDYLHTITYDPTKLKFGTWARDSASATVFEYPSCYPTNLNFTQNRDNYLLLSSNFTADTEVTSGGVNDTSSLASATIANTAKVVGRVADTFLLNAEAGGALADPTDVFCPSSFSLNLIDAKESEACFSSTASDGAPIRTGLLEGELTLEFLKTEDHTWIDWRDNETTLKCSFDIEGDQIASGLNYQWKFLIPKMIVTNVTTNVDTAGFNAFTVTCKILKATANPTGMSSTYPYFEIINTSSAQITA